MSLTERINKDIKEAMLARDSKKLEALRAVKSALLLAKTDKKSSGGEISESIEMGILQKLVKQRKESAAIYMDKNRSELADEELFQANIIAEYLPKQMSEDEIQEAVKKIIDETGASSMKDMGKVMGVASKQLAGKADNRIISGIVKNLLGA